MADVLRPSIRPILVLLLLAAVPAAASGPDTVVLELDRLERTYQDLAPDMAPVERGPVIIQLSSPAHRLDLRDARLSLTPVGDGSHDALLELEFEGAGTVIADFQMAESASSLTDELVVPLQRRSVTARVRFERTETGYLVTTESLDPTFEVEIDSRVGRQLVTACRPLSMLGLLQISCDGLERAVTNAVIPMPSPGETYIIDREQFTPAVADILDGYLDRHAVPEATPE